MICGRRRSDTVLIEVGWPPISRVLPGRCILWRGGFPESKTRSFTWHNRSGTRKKIGRRGWKDQSWD